MATLQSLTDVQLLGQVNCSGADSMTLPAATIREQDFRSDTKTAAANVIHVVKGTHTQAGGTDVIEADEQVYQAPFAGSVYGVRMTAEVIPAGGDKDVTVDVLRSTGGGAFASILSAAEVIDTGNTDRVSVTSSLSGTITLSAGDVIKITTAVSGSTGTQAQGLIVDVICHEQAQA